jgi:hypothetical protein
VVLESSSNSRQDWALSRTLRRGTDDDQQALGIVLQAGLHGDAVGPEVDVALGREVAPGLSEPKAGPAMPRLAPPSGTGAVGGAEQGISVALSADGNTAIVGGSTGTGAAWVFTRSGNVWTQQGTANEAKGQIRPSRPLSEYRNLE